MARAARLLLLTLAFPLVGCLASAKRGPGGAERSVEPTSLWIDAPEGATIAIDREVVGTAILKRDVGVPPGRHVVTASTNGHREGSVTVDVAEGEKRLVSIELEDSKQRTASYVIIGSGLGGLAIAVAAGVAAVVKQREASELDNGLFAPPGDQEAYDAAIQARDGGRIVAGVAGGVGLGLIVTGGLLFAFDPPRTTHEKSNEKETGLALIPMAGPGGGGLDLRGVW